MESTLRIIYHNQRLDGTCQGSAALPDIKLMFYRNDEVFIVFIRGIDVFSDESISAFTDNAIDQLYTFVAYSKDQTFDGVLNLASELRLGYFRTIRDRKVRNSSLGVSDSQDMSNSIRTVLRAPLNAPANARSIITTRQYLLEQNANNPPGNNNNNGVEP